MDGGRRGMRHEARLPLHQVKAIFNALDKNNDGSITHSEFIRGALARATAARAWRSKSKVKCEQVRAESRAHALQ